MILKNISISFIIASMLYGNVLAYVTPGDTPFTSTPENIDTQVEKAENIIGISKTTDIRAVVFAWANFVLGLLGIIALVLIIFYAYKAIVLAHDESQLKKIYKMLFYMVAGFIVILSSYLIVNSLI